MNGKLVRNCDALWSNPDNIPAFIRRDSGRLQNKPVQITGVRAEI